MDVRPARTHSHFRHSGRWSHVWLAVLYLCALSLLIVWEYRERLEVLSSECVLRDETRSSSYGRWYSKFLDWASPVTTGHVVTVAIPAELEEVQSNVCLGRAYLADVLRAVSVENPSVVVIDKFFGPNTCSRTPESTEALLRAVREVRAPVVVGESTDGLEEPVGKACLVRRPQLDFGAPNVVRGLTRLDMDAERLPLRWQVLAEAPEEEHGRAGHPEAEAQYADSLMLAAVKLYAPEFVERRSVQRLIAHDDHAYSSLEMPLPRVTTTELLCSAGDAAVRKRWDLECSGQPLPARLLGKVVVIGSENASDLKNVLGRHMFGFQLQAMYMESLLSGDYLRTVPIEASFALFAVFVFVMEGLPVLLVTYRPHWKNKFLLRYAYPRQRYVWVVFWAAVLIVATSVLAFALRFLPPLLIYGDILFIAITRLLHYSAESAEHPLIHAHHHHRKEEHHAKADAAEADAPTLKTESHQG
ncbi:CHASE2 domain protein [Terriglobus roseus DSM 18391]|uniref:CHASE2 domain protein n=1 Tax=Terriglobus roseus (strain DSM 18391 / NRRL B-41598 / KBS 63) TaxID=926566 RepID=I3ZCF1_TERRK|nr:CHASE2 domain-containing protein [Terriglobus roseus]AFL86919.1 CHASE2 domain protein [Terriglobus roseus DSM 18391]